MRQISPQIINCIALQLLSKTTGVEVTGLFQQPYSILKYCLCIW